MRNGHDNGGANAASPFSYPAALDLLYAGLHGAAIFTLRDPLALVFLLVAIQVPLALQPGPVARRALLRQLGNLPLFLAVAAAVAAGGREGRLVAELPLLGVLSAADVEAGAVAVARLACLAAAAGQWTTRFGAQAAADSLVLLATFGGLVPWPNARTAATVAVRALALAPAAAALLVAAVRRRDAAALDAGLAALVTADGDAPASRPTAGRRAGAVDGGMASGAGTATILFLLQLFLVYTVAAGGCR